MKNLTILKITAILILFLAGGIEGWAQTLTVNGQTLSEHGYNSSGADRDPGTEARDSVTTGSTTRYYVLPDATANASYGGTAAPLTGTLTSSFTWASNTPTGTAAIGSIAAISPALSAYGHYRQITWAGTGTLNLTVQEVSSAGCGGTPTSIPIEVIAAPTLTYPAAGGTEDTCFSGTNGSLNVQPTKRFWVNFTSPISGVNKSLQIRVDVTRNTGSVLIADDVLVNFTQTSATSGYFTLPASAALNFYDAYTITLVSVSDRISRKGSYWNNASGNTTFAYTVYPVPTTGRIYHLPNM